LYFTTILQELNLKRKIVFKMKKLFPFNFWPPGNAAKVILSFSIVNNEKQRIRGKYQRISGKEVKSREVPKKMADAHACPDIKVGYIQNGCHSSEI